MQVKHTPLKGVCTWPECLVSQDAAGHPSSQLKLHSAACERCSALSSFSSLKAANMTRYCFREKINKTSETSWHSSLHGTSSDVRFQKRKAASQKAYVNVTRGNEQKEKEMVMSRADCISCPTFLSILPVHTRTGGELGAQEHWKDLEESSGEGLKRIEVGIRGEKTTVWNEHKRKKNMDKGGKLLN